MFLPQRPPLTPGLSEAEFLRWYWLKEELQVFARTSGLSTAGSKAAISGRITAFLDGRPPQEEPTPPRRGTVRLVPPLTMHTVIPAGHPCSQVLRSFLENALGPGFRFDAPMREFFAANDGTATMGAAVAHWHATRSQTYRPIGTQFELNRFSRDWYRANPGGTREQMLAAWKNYRSLPVDLRGTAPAGAAGSSGRTIV